MVVLLIHSLREEDEDDLFVTAASRMLVLDLLLRLLDLEKEASSDIHLK